MSVLSLTPCASSASGAGWAKPGRVSAYSSPARTKEFSGYGCAARRAAPSSSTGTTSFAPCASAATIVVVANRMSSTITTLPGTRTESSSSFFVRTWILWFRSIFAAKEPPACHRQDQLAALVGGLEAVLHQPDALARIGGARFDHDAAVGERVADAHRPQPADIVDAGRAEAHGPVDVGLAHQSHAHCAGVPAAGDQAAERAVLRLFRIHMEWLRIE